MHVEPRYIQFNRNQIGEDGRRYFWGIKYRIAKEDSKYIYLKGNGELLNKFPIEEYKKKATIGNIIGSR